MLSTALPTRATYMFSNDLVRMLDSTPSGSHLQDYFRVVLAVKFSILLFRVLMKNFKQLESFQWAWLNKINKDSPVSIHWERQDIALHWFSFLYQPSLQISCWLVPSDIRRHIITNSNMPLYMKTINNFYIGFLNLRFWDNLCLLVTRSDEILTMPNKFQCTVI